MQLNDYLYQTVTHPNSAVTRSWKDREVGKFEDGTWKVLSWNNFLQVLDRPL